MPDRLGGARGLARVAFSGLLAAAGLVLVARFFEPLPVPALTAIGGGLLAYWLAGTHRLAKTALGLVVGAVPGGVIHQYMHYAEDRLEPAEGLWEHIGLDLAAGLAVAVSILAVVAGLDYLLPRRSPPGETDSGAG